MQLPEFVELRDYPVAANLVVWPPRDTVRDCERCALCRQWVFTTTMENHVKRHREFEARQRQRRAVTADDVQSLKQMGIKLDREG